MNAEPGRLAITGQPVGIVVEGPPDAPDGRRVDSRPASGGRSYSVTDGAGEFTAELSGSLNKGRANESHVLDVLIQALRDSGRSAASIAGSRDDHGEDGLLELDGRRVGVQIVSVPVDQSLWKDLSSQDRVNRSGTIDDAVEMIRQALVHKKDKAAGTLLVLDVAYFGALVGPSLVRAYHKAHGNPEREFSLVEAWLVGPTSRSAFRMGSNES